MLRQVDDDDAKILQVVYLPSSSSSFVLLLLLVIITGKSRRPAVLAMGWRGKRGARVYIFHGTNDHINAIMSMITPLSLESVVKRYHVIISRAYSHSTSH